MCGPLLPGVCLGVVVMGSANQRAGAPPWRITPADATEGGNDDDGVARADAKRCGGRGNKDEGKGRGEWAATEGGWTREQGGAAAHGLETTRERPVSGRGTLGVAAGGQERRWECGGFCR